MATSNATSAKFENPPVVESILGVQFPALAFTSGHLGWFWKSYLGESWPKATDAPPLTEGFERFDDQAWGVPGIQIGVAPFRAARLQLRNVPEDRVVQVQNNRFIYNWRKRDGAYASYLERRKEFIALYGRFTDFVRDAGLGAIAPNQWEVTYIDHIPKGELWQTPSDWYRILPGLLPVSRKISDLEFDNAGDLHFVITPQRGRLHIAIQHGRTDADVEVLVVNWTARGPISTQLGGLVEGLDLGHEVILRAFLEMSSPEARKAWERRQ